MLIYRCIDKIVFKYQEKTNLLMYEMSYQFIMLAVINQEFFYENINVKEFVLKSRREF